MLPSKCRTSLVWGSLSKASASYGAAHISVSDRLHGWTLAYLRSFVNDGIGFGGSGVYVVVNHGHNAVTSRR